MARLRKSASRRRKRAAAAAVVVAAAASLGMTGGHERAQLSVGMNFKRLSATEGWGRVFAVGGTFYGFRARGVDFTITDIKSARGSGGTPTCTVTSGLLDCRGTFPDGSSIFVNFGISGSGNSFQEENFFSATPNSTPQFFGTQPLGPAPLPVTAKLVGTSTSTSKTVTYGGQSAFSDVEIMPFNFKIGNVTKSSPSAVCKPEGPGIECSVNLTKGQTGSITFDTSPSTVRAVTGRRDSTDEAEVLLHGDDGTGFIDVFETTTEAKYDLYWTLNGKGGGAFPPEYLYGWRYGVGFPLEHDWVGGFWVVNAPSAERPSEPTSFSVKVSGNAAASVAGGLGCKEPLVTIPALAPGKGVEACLLVWKAWRKGVPLRPKRRADIRVTFTLQCFVNLESNCSNNRTTIGIALR